MGRILLGTCGYYYPEWHGVFYPEGMLERDFFKFYQRQFSTVELDSTFYHLPNPKSVKRWVLASFPDFMFSSKLQKTISHELLGSGKQCGEELDRYLECVDSIERTGKMYANLLQLPPFFNYEQHFNVLKSFLKLWEERTAELRKEYAPKLTKSSIISEGFNLAVEFRNQSWNRFEVFELLKSVNVAYCTVIEPILPFVLQKTHKEIQYIRFHGFGRKPFWKYLFSEEEIEAWAEKIKPAFQNSKSTVLYFNNHFSGNAVKNAKQMRKKLNLLPPSSKVGLDRFMKL